MKPDCAIKNGQSRETGNIAYTRHKTKRNKTKNTTHHVFDTPMHKPTQITFVKLTLNNKGTINNFVIINTSLDKRSTYSTHF